MELTIYQCSGIVVIKQSQRGCFGGGAKAQCLTPVRATLKYSGNGFAAPAAALSPTGLPALLQGHRKQRSRV